MLTKKFVLVALLSWTATQSTCVGDFTFCEDRDGVARGYDDCKRLEDLGTPCSWISDGACVGANTLCAEQGDDAACEKLRALGGKCQWEAEARRLLQDDPRSEVAKSTCLFNEFEQMRRDFEEVRQMIRGYQVNQGEIVKIDEFEKVKQELSDLKSHLFQVKFRPTEEPTEKPTQTHTTLYANGVTTFYKVPIVKHTTGYVMTEHVVEACEAVGMRPTCWSNNGDYNSGASKDCTREGLGTDDFWADNNDVCAKMKAYHGVRRRLWTNSPLIDSDEFCRNMLDGTAGYFNPAQKNGGACVFYSTSSPRLGSHSASNAVDDYCNNPDNHYSIEPTYENFASGGVLATALCTNGEN